MDAKSGYALTVAVMATANAFQRESQRLFRPHGLTAAQFNVLNVLGLKSEGMSQRELSEVLVVDRSNVTGMLDRMEEAGWVKRTPVVGDRRAYRVILTQAGVTLWKEVEPLYLDVVSQVTAGMSKADMATTIALLQKLESAAAKWTLPSAS